MADIDLSSADQNGNTAGNFSPIGNNTDGGFTAILEGNGHTISNLAIDTATGVTSANNDANDAALIASCRAAIRNITLSNATITGRRRLGALCATQNAASINNARITGGAITQSDTAVNFAVYAGALSGYVHGASAISNSSAAASVSNSSAADSNVGGLVGEMLNASAISNSYATGAISASISSSDSNYAGGLVGEMLNTSAVSNSYATGAVGSSIGATLSNNYAGGLVGEMENTSTVSNSYATGANTVVATNSSESINSTAGLVGWISASTVALSNSYATGAITVTGASINRVAGLVGLDQSNTYANCYWNSEAVHTRSGTALDASNKRGVGNQSTAPSGVTAQTLAQILALTAATLNWNATLHWQFTANEHPKLRYANNPHTSSVNECETLPGFGNSDADKPRCGDLLPGQ